MGWILTKKPSVISNELCVWYNKRYRSLYLHYKGLTMAGGTFKGRYTFCENCKHRRLKVVVNRLDPTTTSFRYDCLYSHKQVRKSGGVKFERDFKMCGLIENA